MALQAGHLLINRRRITLAVGANDIDTGLRQVGVNFAPDPILDGLDPPAPGNPGVPSRVMVIPLPNNLAAWDLITVHEPFFDAATGTVHVIMDNGGGGPEEVNVLFWDPHTNICPLSADTYIPEPQPG